MKELIIKCPVCETIYDNEVKVCNKCRFTELNKVFLSKEDYQKWVEDVVKPFQEMYQKKCAEKEKLRKKQKRMKKKSCLYNSNWKSRKAIRNNTFYASRTKFRMTGIE